jgi:hypothetical protein
MKWKGRGRVSHGKTPIELVFDFIAIPKCSSEFAKFRSPNKVLQRKVLGTKYRIQNAFHMII